MALADIAQQPGLSLQHALHLLPYRSDKYTPTGHTPAAVGGMGGATAAVVGDAGSSSSSGGAVGPIGLFRRKPHQRLQGLPGQQTVKPIEQEAWLEEKAGKRLADCVEALIGAVYCSAAAAGDGEGSVPVSEAGLAAAAAFCEAIGVLPQGALGVLNLRESVWLCC